MPPKPRHIALLSTIALLLAVVSVSAAAAAEIHFEWKVSGAPLAAGKTKAITAKAISGSPLNLAFTFGGAAIAISSSQVQYESGADIVGGRPGTGEGRLVLEGIKVTKPASCGVKEIVIGEASERITLPVTEEIVEKAFGGSGSGTTEVLFAPTKGGKIMTEFELTGTACTLKGTEIVPTGTLLAEAGPQGTEAKVGHLSFIKALTKSHGAVNNEYRTAAGGPFKLGYMEWGGNAATVAGEVETELVSKEVFGVF
jgi:hypothetical protein